MRCGLLGGQRRTGRGWVLPDREDQWSAGARDRRGPARSCLSTPPLSVTLCALRSFDCNLKHTATKAMADSTKPEETKEVKETPRSTAEADFTKYKVLK